MKRFFKVIGWILAVLVVVGLGAYLVARSVALKAYEKEWVAHHATFPIPFPLSETELAALRSERLAGGGPDADPIAGVDLAALARARAVERGKHLVETRFGCNGCHGKDFGGSVMIDSPIVAYWAAPNLTSGEGSVTRGFTAENWDRAVRHGIRRNGHSSSMPSNEFLTMSDHELSDVVSFLTSVPPVNRQMKPVSLGPVFAFLVAFDSSAIPAFSIDHQKAHPFEPPPPAPSKEFGEHIVQVCRGCHGPTLSGGKVQGDPNMPIVANLTPHETGLKDWTEADFIRALREGKRKDGTAISPMMPWQAYGGMSDVELKAIWAYLRTVPAVAKGNH